MNHVWAYIGFFLYMVFDVVLGELLKKLLKMDSDIIRKIQHILTFPCWVILYLTTGCSIHAVIITGVGTALLAFITFSGLFKAVQRSESHNYGVFYFGLACFIVTLLCHLFFPDKYYLVGITYFCLSLADGFAPLTAKWFKKINREIRPTKSIIGCLTVYLLSLATVFAFNLIFNIGLSPLFLFAFASTFTLAEYYGYKGLDNLFTVLLSFGFLVLEIYGLNNIALSISLLLFPFITVLNSFKRSLTEMALFTALITISIASYFGGLVILLMFLLLFFVNAIVVGVVRRVLRKKGYDIKKSKPRGAIQILCNSLVTAVLSIVYYFTNMPAFLIAAIIVVVENFADSMASDIGRYAKRQPLDILRFKRVEAGLSGGVSLLGTVVALISIFAVLTFPFAFNTYDWVKYLVCSAIAFIGVFIDSILGSSIQNKNICPVCNKVTEDKIHCEVETKHHSGLKFITNSGVNFLTSLLTCGLSLLIFLTCF